MHDMRLAALFSGGKDSTLAMHKAMKGHEVVCLISMISENDASYMFHVPNIHITDLPENCTMTVFTMKGDIILQLTGTMGEITWDLKDQNGNDIGLGIYVLRIGNDAEMIYRKVLIVK